MFLLSSAMVWRVAVINWGYTRHAKSTARSLLAFDRSIEPASDLTTNVGKLSTRMLVLNELANETIDLEEFEAGSTPLY